MSKIVELSEQEPIQLINNELQEIKAIGYDIGSVSDGFHTFNELYDFRKVYNALLFNEWATHGRYDVHKSLKHHDGELCFNGGWFIVVAILPSGQISNHYEVSDWDLFNITVCDKAKYAFDGHGGNDVLKRLKDLIK